MKSSGQKHELCLSKGTEAEDLTLAYFKGLKQRLLGGNRQRGRKRKMGPHKKNLTAGLKNLASILGNGKSFGKILRQP